MGESTTQATLTENTKLPLKFVALIVGAVVSGVLYLHTVMFQLRSDIRALQVEVQSLTSRIENGNSDRWKIIDMEMWVEMLRTKNPTLSVPEAVRRR